MYRWQTLTLARLESALKRNDTPRTAVDDESILRNACDILYRIGLKHFPEPLVSQTPTMHISTLGPVSACLIWEVDERVMKIEFAGSHVGYDLTHPDGGMSEAGDLDPVNCVAEVREFAHWLLTGYRPPQEPPAALSPVEAIHRRLFYPETAASSCTPSGRFPIGRL